MINQFDIKFQVNGIDYIATAENYLLPGQIRITDITPTPTDFPSEILFDKDHVRKTLLYDKDLDRNTMSQIIEATDRTAKEEGIGLYLSNINL